MADKDGNKTGGRQAGTPNKVESKTKIFLRDLMDKNVVKIEKELKKLEGKPYLDAINNLLEYSEPKLSRAEVKAEVTDTTRKIGFKDDSQS